ncbi:MAG: 50S ribosomal protein L7ae-like protein [Clostridiales bacterium]|nr:50S ribosomal protein L7ae-like protein [Clostridiales bacterium]
MPERLRTSEKLVGINQAKKAVLNDKTRTVFIAEDCEARVVAPLLDICQNKAVEIVNVKTMKQLGELCGIQVGAAAAALLA